MSLGNYSQPSDMAAALGDSLTTEWLKRMYSIILDHILRLEKIAEILSLRLRDCGD